MNVGNTISNDTVLGDGGAARRDWVVPDFKLLAVSETLGSTSNTALPIDGTGIGYS